MKKFLTCMVLLFFIAISCMYNICYADLVDLPSIYDFLNENNENSSNIVPESQPEKANILPIIITEIIIIIVIIVVITIAVIIIEKNKKNKDQKDKI